MENDKLKTYVDEFYVYLKEPMSFGDLDDDNIVLTHNIVKNFKLACDEDPSLIVKSIEFIAKNIQALDTYKVGISCKLFCNIINLSNPPPFVSGFIIGVFVRTLVLTDKYINKSLNFIENSEIISSSPDDYKAWKCLDAVTYSADIILSLSLSVRNKFRENKNYDVLITRLKTFIKPLENIFNLYRLTDNEEIIVIEPQKLLGFRILLNGVQNNYHLFTLLQFELAEKASHLLNISADKNDDALQFAKGIKKFNIHTNIPVKALLSFFTCKSFFQSVKNRTPLTSQIHINGSLKPNILPGFEGNKIIFISEPIKSHLQWDSFEFKPINQYLTSEAKLIEIISKKTVSELIDKLKS